MFQHSITFPSADDIQHFENYGYVISPPFLPSTLIEAALYGAERIYAGERDWMMPVSAGFLDWRPEHPEGLRINDYASLQCKEINDLVTYPSLGRAFAALLGAKIIRLFHDQLISKDGNCGPVVGWHVDKAYWQTCSSQQMMTAWIPLNRYSSGMGPLLVIPRSHRWAGNEWMRTFGHRNLNEIIKRVKSDGEDLEVVEILIDPGQVSFHHASLIHGSGENVEKNTRVALTVHVQDGDNKYKRAQDERGKIYSHVNDVLCKPDASGAPDYSDPEICPVLWPKLGSI